MKKPTTRSLHRLLFKIAFFSNYTEQICSLEKALARKPEKLQLDIIGPGEVAPDTALLVRSILLKRFPKTHLITNARSSLQGSAVLIWLLGDTRLIREDARLLFRRPLVQSEDEEGDAWKAEAPETPEADLEEVDYAQVLEYIDQYLPVKELAGRPINLEGLRQFGLVDNEKVDRFLESAFAKGDGTAAPPRVEEGSGHPQFPKAPCSEQSN